MNSVRKGEQAFSLSPFPENGLAGGSAAVFGEQNVLSRSKANSFDRRAKSNNRAYGLLAVQLANDDGSVRFSSGPNALIGIELINMGRIRRAVSFEVFL